ncbi:MAG TPA: glycosyltransferase family 2 protein, partial [Chthoniobacterales bacterium]
EDKLDAGGCRCDPHFKPAWNPDLLLSQNYVAHLSVYRADLVRRIGGFRRGFEGAEDYDLALRATEEIAPAQILHIPHVLYHSRRGDESPTLEHDALEAARRAVDEHLHRIGSAASVETITGSYRRVRYALPEPAPTVSIIIATRDHVDLLRACIESILARTAYPNFELIIVDNESTDRVALDYLTILAKKPRVRILREPGAFNFSRLNNIGVAQASSQFVVLLNNDIEVTDGDWLGEMVAHGLQPGIGAVGARLLYPDGRIQHAGVVLGLAGIGSHAHHGLRHDEDGYFSRPHLTQNVSAVTGACLLVRRHLYLQLGGLDDVNLPVAFNDIDLCLRIGAAGLRVVYTPHAELLHHESASRGYEDTPEKHQRMQKEAEYMRSKWRPQLEADPAYNPNLALDSGGNFKLAFPPRVQKPWRQF